MLSDIELLRVFEAAAKGAGLRVYVPNSILVAMGNLAEWYGYEGGSEFKNDVITSWVPLSEARELILRAKQQIANQVAQALS